MCYFACWEIFGWLFNFNTWIMLYTDLRQCEDRVKKKQQFTHWAGQCASYSLWNFRQLAAFSSLSSRHFHSWSLAFQQAFLSAEFGAAIAAGNRERYKKKIHWVSEIIVVVYVEVKWLWPLLWKREQTYIWGKVTTTRKPPKIKTQMF